jgi:hypothetical protein
MSFAGIVKVFDTVALLSEAARRFIAPRRTSSVPRYIPKRRVHLPH